MSRRKISRYVQLASNEACRKCKKNLNASYPAYIGNRVGFKESRCVIILKHSKCRWLVEVSLCLAASFLFIEINATTYRTEWTKLEKERSKDFSNEWLIDYSPSIWLNSEGHGSYQWTTPSISREERCWALGSNPSLSCVLPSSLSLLKAKRWMIDEGEINERAGRGRLFT